MRAIKIVGHPALLISIFLMLIIEGDHFGGFYLLFLLLAMPHAALYAITAAAGIALVIGGHQEKKLKWAQVLSVAGLTLMIVSLLIFFGKRDKTGVDATFYDTVPLLSFIVLCVSMICFILRTIFLAERPSMK